MRRPKPGSLWLEPLEAWCGLGVSRDSDLEKGRLAGRKVYRDGGRDGGCSGMGGAGGIAVGPARALWHAGRPAVPQLECPPGGLEALSTTAERELREPRRALENEAGPRAFVQAKTSVPASVSMQATWGEIRAVRAVRAEMWADIGLRQRVEQVSELRMESLRMDVTPNLADVRAYFEEALEEAPVLDAAGRLRFERWDNVHWGVSWRRGVLSSLDGVLYLDWLANDDFGLSEVREFFEAPFFDAVQTRLWFTWLQEGGWHEATLRGRRMGMIVRVRGQVLHLRLYW